MASSTLVDHQTYEFAAPEESETLAEVSSMESMEQQAQSNWWWDRASMIAPAHQEWYYFEFTLWSIAYFFAVHFLCHVVAKRNAPIYASMTTIKQAEYRTYTTSFIHALVCVFLSTIAMFYICGEGKTVFNSDECINTVRYVHIWALIHTCGYFIVDFIYIWFVIEGSSALDYQTYAHHIIATVTFYQTLYFMDFLVVFGVMLLFMEISTLFVSMRWLLYTHGYAQSKWYALNAIMMFVTFLLGRLVYQIYILVGFGADWIYAEYMKKNLTLYTWTVITEMAVMVLLSILLNSYWMLLMIKMMARVIRRAMVTKSVEPIENVELIKADSLAQNEQQEEYNDADCAISTKGSNAGENIEEEQNDPEIQNQKLDGNGMEI